MLEFSKKTNQLMQSKYKYQLQEVEEPNLYREIFDYEAIPKIAFNNRLVPICVPDEIWMTDTTFRAGIHADGLLKDEEIYNIFDTAAILNRPATVAVDAHSGLAGIAHWINSFFRLKGKHQVDKQDSLVLAVKDMVDALYASGRNTVMGDEELEIMVRDADPERYERLLFHKSR